jgi:hypothetical protein
MENKVKQIGLKLATVLSIVLLTFSSTNAKAQELEYMRSILEGGLYTNLVANFPSSNISVEGENILMFLTSEDIANLSYDSDIQKFEKEISNTKNLKIASDAFFRGYMDGFSSEDRDMLKTLKVRYIVLYFILLDNRVIKVGKQKL